MRCLLIDRARRRQADKRGGGAAREELHDSALAAPVPDEELLAVHEWVDALARKDPQAGELVKLRYFIGLTQEEAAAALGVSSRTAGNLWEYGRARLHREIQRARQAPR